MFKPTINSIYVMDRGIVTFSEKIADSKTVKVKLEIQRQEAKVDGIVQNYWDVIGTIHLITDGKEKVAKLAEFEIEHGVCAWIGIWDDVFKKSACVPIESGDITRQDLEHRKDQTLVTIDCYAKGVYVSSDSLLRESKK